MSYFLSPALRLMAFAALLLVCVCSCHADDCSFDGLARRQPPAPTLAWGGMDSRTASPVAWASLDKRKQVALASPPVAAFRPQQPVLYFQQPSQPSGRCRWTPYGWQCR
jgi:hypothetical protein